jgi:pSer/pThr/pTyr-binding forkhead associated (FHA) protein
MLVDDGFTSGHHAQFIFNGNQVQLYDYGSTNGTFVNGQRVTNATLEHNCTIKIGSSEMRFLAQ